MSFQKPSLPRGTRDFSPETMVRRNHILNTIRTIFENYGYLPLETPAIENLSVLTGKYGDESDKLLFKILDSGDFLTNLKQDIPSMDVKTLTSKISEKGLRYDLTVPLARYVVMNQHEIAFPFKRYQIQPVWRADRPQKGRYREFYQCDADIVGTKSLTCEAEIIRMVEDVSEKLRIPVTTKINSRKILEGLVELVGAKGKEQPFYVAIDKLDKIGKEKVLEELSAIDFRDDMLYRVTDIFEIKGKNEEKIQHLRNLLEVSKIGNQGLDDIESVLMYSAHMGSDHDGLEFDVTLARGLSYYTGIIFEVKARDINIGSIGGGGRYDDLAGLFGLQDVSGVGFSFGVDRMYDVMAELALFPQGKECLTRALIVCFDDITQKKGLELLNKLRVEKISSEIFPDLLKMKKQLNYANKKGIPFVVIIGQDEMQKDRYTLKDMETGIQREVSYDILIQSLK